MAERIDFEASSSSRTGGGETLVVDHGRRKGSCGYCKSNGRSSLAHGLWAHSITVDDYQELLDRGWRRSGSFLYKPEMERTCCPAYTIRLKADDFVPSREQNRVSRRMQRFLDGTLNTKKSDDCKDYPNCCKGLYSPGSNISSSTMISESSLKGASVGSSEDKPTDEREWQDLSVTINNAIAACISTDELPSVEFPMPCVKRVTLQTKKKLLEISENLLYTSNIAFQIAAALRRSQSAEKIVPESVSNDARCCRQSMDFSPTIVAEKLEGSLNQQGKLFGLSAKACNGHLNFYSTTIQTASGEAPATHDITMQSPRDFGANTNHRCILGNNLTSQSREKKLEIHLKQSSFDPEEYALYRRYQIKVHNEKPDQVMESSYKRFLVETPIVFVPPSSNRTVPPCGFGSFHQQYVIDGKLVAVGVVDILPKCLSSKYLFWDPDFAFLSLGKYSALQEIKWVKEAQIHCPSLQYYYLGYYIHSCSKMRYKAAYHPSELLCPLRYQWVQFHIAKPLLDKKPYVILSDFPALHTEASSPYQVPKNSLGQPCVNADQEDNDADLSDEDEMELDFEDTRPDDELDPEACDEALVDISNIVIKLHGTHLRFKDLQRVVGPIDKRHINLLEAQLQSYVRVVGAGLAGHMVYSLG